MDEKIDADILFHLHLSLLTLKTEDGDVKVAANDISPHSPVIKAYRVTINADTIPIPFASKQDILSIVGFVNGRPIDSTSTIYIVRRLKMTDLLSRMLAVRWRSNSDPGEITLHDALLDLKDICNSNHLQTSRLYLSVFVRIIGSIAQKGSLVKKALNEELLTSLFGNNKDLTVLFKRLYLSDHEMFEGFHDVIMHYTQSSEHKLGVVSSPFGDTDYFTCKIDYHRLNGSDNTHAKLDQLKGLTNAECRYVTCNTDGWVRSVVLDEDIKVDTTDISTFGDQLLDMCRTHKVDSHEF